MKSVNVKLDERSYTISIDSGLLQDPHSFSSISEKDSLVIVTNTTIENDFGYASELAKTLQKCGCNPDILVLPDGEKYKNLETFNDILTHLLEKNCGRDVKLIALGGGVIGDLTGFAAASYQRGVKFIQVPTTLLAQVDSSVGGKTGVNHPLGKNMIGAFYQPQSVVIDINCLSTLPDRELSAGMAEVIKYGIIIDNEFFSWLEENISSIMSLNKEALSHTIARCCQIKADVVALDEKEAGVRALLNLGHTFGHAIEAHMGYGNWLHGEGVAVGMVLAAQLAVARGELTSAELARIVRIIQAANLPIKAPIHMTYNDFLTHMLHDKKVLSGKIRFVLPTTIGSSQVVSDVDLKMLETVIQNHLQS